MYKNFNNMSKDDPSILTSPKSKRDEIQSIRKRLDEYQEFKKNHIMIGRRERTIKGGWRHGITGIDNADSDQTSIFYRENKLM